ncbi:hypothetical protein [Brevibacillus laterosporus]|uniref:hypothetical protein n=1 Tax=Brevibacillus laterosporus TaxID=1465 RepID=UPI003D1B5DC5
MIKRTLFILLFALNMGCVVYATDIVFSYGGGDIVSFVHSFGWSQTEDNGYIKRGDLYIETSNFVNFTVRNLSSDYSYVVFWTDDLDDSRKNNRYILPGKEFNFHRRDTYKGFRIEKGGIAPKPEPEPKPDPEPELPDKPTDPKEPPIVIVDPDDKPIERTKEKFIHIPFDLIFITKEAWNIIRVSNAYVWLFAVVFFGILIFSVGKKIFNKVMK